MATVAERPWLYALQAIISCTDQCCCVFIVATVGVCISLWYTQALAIFKLLMVTITQEPPEGPLPPLPTVRDIAEGPINQLPATAGCALLKSMHVWLSCQPYTNKQDVVVFYLSFSHTHSWCRMPMRCLLPPTQARRSPRNQLQCPPHLHPTVCCQGTTTQRLQARG